MPAVRAAGALAAVAALVVAAVAFAAGPAAEPRPPAAAPARQVGTFIDQGVRVRVRVAPSGSGAAGSSVLEATFTPVQAGFHLYSLDLPPDGIEGVGRPTSVQVGGGLTATGTPVADRGVVAIRAAGVDQPVPVYPDGPVTVRLAARYSPALPLQVWVGYAACSRVSCLPPVNHRLVRLEAA